jgi:hypothetical protein
MPRRFHAQAEYYLRLARIVGAPADKAQLFSMACAWHRLSQELDLHDACAEDGEPHQDRPSIAA